MFTKFFLKQIQGRALQIRNSILIIVLLFAMAGFDPANAAGLIHYVDNTNPACSDSGAGHLPESPFCTISKGASAALAGDTVRVLAGTYAETVSVPKSGSAGLPIIYSAAPGVVVTGNSSPSTGGAFRVTSRSYVTIDGFTVTGTLDYGLYAWGSDHITLSNNHVSYSGLPQSGSTKAGIYLVSVTDSIITGNTSDHNSQDGIKLAERVTSAGVHYGSVNNLVSNNIAFANAEGWQRNATGIQVTGSSSSDNTIINNITYANEDTGLQNYSGAHNNILVGNISYGNGDHGIDNLNSPNNIAIGNTIQGNHTAGINFEGTGSGSSGAIIMNNISVDNGINPITGQKSNIRVDASSILNTSMDYNLVYLSGAGTSVIQWNGVSYATLAAFKAAVPGQEVHGIQADPRFVAPVGYATRPPAVVVGDFHIQAGSPAIDSANSEAPYEPGFDIEGLERVDDPATNDTGFGARTYDDRGAYEYQTNGNSLPVLTTQAVTDILAFSATGNGSFTTMGVPSPFEHGLVWSTAANPTIADGKTLQGPTTQTGAFSGSMTNLAPNTLYYVRAYATNEAGTAYGNEVTFNTALVMAEYTLTVNSLHGIVTRSPDQSFYHDGDVVTLGMTAEPGWTFTGWDPALTNNTVTINGNTTVSANFTQNEYILTVNSDHGTVTKTPNQATYHYGDVVTLGMTAVPGWTFTGWTPALTNNTVTIMGDTSVTANFTQDVYTLTINTIGSGTVTKDKEAPYYYGDVVNLTALPITAGWNFSSWSGDLSGTVTPITITMDGNKNVTATFTQNEYTLTVNSPYGIVTKTPNQATYHDGDVVTLSMAANTGWTFTGWTPALTNDTVTISGNTTVTANFTQNDYILTVNSDHGTVTKTPNLATYHYGDVVTLGMTADPGWTFTGWTPALTNNTVTISGNTTVTANFTQSAYTLTVNSAHGTVTKTPNLATYHYGDVVTLGMTAAPGWTFTSWTPALTNNTVTISGNTIVTANFTQNEYILTVNSAHGTVTKTPNLATYHYGDVVTLGMTIDPGWTFTSWTPALTKNSVTIIGNTTVTANFTQNAYTLTIAISPRGSGTVTKTPNQTTYHYGDVVKLTATPATNWHFVSWSVNVISGSVTIRGNTSVTATFARNNLTISGSVGTAGAGASLSYTGGSSPVIANSTGNYSISVPYSWSGTVTPKKTSYAFTPTQKSYKNITTNQTAQNYTAKSTIPLIPITIEPNGIMAAPLSFRWKESTAPGPIAYRLSVYNTLTRKYAIYNKQISVTCILGVCSYMTSLPTGSYSFSVAALNKSGMSGLGLSKNWRTFKVR